MALSFCVVCRARIPRGSRCSRHRTVSPSNRSWHQPGAAGVRAAVLERDGHACTACGATEGLEVHHLVAAEDGGPTTPANCTTLCFDCHRETEAENRGGWGPR